QEHGWIVFVNPAGIRLLGAEREDEVLGRHLSEFVHPDFHDALRARPAASAGRAPAPAAHQVLLTRDRTPIEAEVWTVPFEVAGRRAVGLIARDVGRGRRVARALRRSEETLAAFLRNVPGAAFIKDAKGRYVLVNERLATTRGVPR